MLQLLIKIKFTVLKKPNLLWSRDGKPRISIT